MPVLVKLEGEDMNIFGKSLSFFKFYNLADTTGDQYGLCECL